jgi:hypothetical protein
MKRPSNWIGLLVLSSLACLAADTNSIIGEWATGRIMSQLGPQVTTYAFETNGIFWQTTVFEHGRIRPFISTGTFAISTNTIFLQMRLRTNAVAYALERDTLIIDEGHKEVFRLKKVKR